MSTEEQVDVIAEEIKKGMESGYAWIKKTGKVLIDGGTLGKWDAL